LIGGAIVSVEDVSGAPPELQLVVKRRIARRNRTLFIMWSIIHSLVP
jgi:hypothetical protein